MKPKVIRAINNLSSETKALVNSFIQGLLDEGSITKDDLSTFTVEDIRDIAKDLTGEGQ